MERQAGALHCHGSTAVLVPMPPPGASSSPRNHGAAATPQPPPTNRPRLPTKYVSVVRRVGDHWVEDGKDKDNSTQGDMWDVEHLYWTFAIILGPADTEDIPEDHASRSLSFQEFVIHTCTKIANAGLHMEIVPRTDTSKHKTILLIRCPEAKFKVEYRKLVLRRWKRTGEGTYTGNNPHHSLIPRDVSERLRAQRADAPPNNRR